VHLVGFYYKNRSYIMFSKEIYLGAIQGRRKNDHFFNGREDLYLFNIYSCIVIIIIFSQKIIF